MCFRNGTCGENPQVSFYARGCGRAPCEKKYRVIKSFKKQARIPRGLCISEKFQKCRPES